MKKRILAVLSALALCLPCIGIGSAKPASALSVIAEMTNVSVEKNTLAVGETVTAVIEWSFGLEQEVHFNSTDESVATVDNNGKVTAVGVGTASILCSVSYGDNKEFEITVTPAVSLYPTSYQEYTDMLESCPDYYRIDEDSVYFLNHDIHSMQMSLIVSSNNELSVSNNTYGSIFSPKEDGRYVVTVLEYCEEIVQDESELGHSHKFYPEIFKYVIDAENGKISTEYKGSYSWKDSEEDVSELDILDGAYFSYANGNIPLGDNQYDRYITTVYGEYSTQSYFCINAPYSDAASFMPRVVPSDESVASVDMTTWTSSAEATNDIMDFFRVKALSDGEVTITVDGSDLYSLYVKDGIFHYGSHADVPVLAGDVNDDGYVDRYDFETLSKWLLSAPSTVINKKAADLNGDETINVFDLCILKRKVVKAENMDFSVLENEWIRDNNERCETMTDQTYIAKSMEELKDILNKYERCNYDDCGCPYHTIEDMIPDGIDESFFEDKAVIIIYGHVDGSGKSVSVDKITPNKNSLLLYTTTERYENLAPDMVYNRIVVSVDKEAVQNADTVSRIDKETIINPEVIDEFTPCTATLDDDFDDFEILIIFKHQYSIPGRIWTIDDFEGVENIDRITQYEATSPYRQYLEIGLLEDSKENVLKLIHDIEALNLDEIKEIQTVKHATGLPPENELDYEEYENFFKNSAIQ